MLVPAGSVLVTPPVAPITPAPPTILEVTPGPLFALEKKGSPQSEECDFRPGSMLAGRYQIKEEIGRGGFSIVYRAVDRSEFRQVAIKRILLSQLTPRQMIDATETFNREVATLPLFTSLPGIPAYYTHLTDAESWYLITRYIEGQPWRIISSKLPVAVSLKKRPSSWASKSQASYPRCTPTSHQLFFAI